MALPRSRSYLGIAKETRPAAGSAPTSVAATDFIPFTTLNPVDQIKYLDDKGIRGSMTEEYGVIQGNRWSEIDFAGDVFPDTIGYVLGGILGDVATSGTVGAYTHVMSLLNSQATNGQPVTWTLSDYYSGGSATTRRFAGCQFGSCDLKFSADALLTYTAKATGYPSATSANPTPSFSTVPPVPSWSGAVSIGGSSTAILADGNVNITRPISPIWTVDGNQNPYQLFCGPLTVSGSLKLVYESDTASGLTAYLTNSQPSLDIVFASSVIQNPTITAATSLTLHMTQAAFTLAKVDRSKDYIEMDITYKAIANTSDVGVSSGFSPIKVTLLNAKASGTYA